MPKVKKQRKFNAHRPGAGAGAETGKAGNAGLAAAVDPIGQLSRGQRKRQEKKFARAKRDVLVIDRREDGKDIEAKPGLKGMVGLLHELEGMDGEGNDPGRKREKTGEKKKGAAFRKVVTNKGKRTLAAVETDHLGAVIRHEAFKADPFAAIQAHLRNTQGNR